LFPRRTETGLKALIAAVQLDEDLRTYMKFRLRGYRPRAVWDRLGWTQNHGKAIDRRFRRVREKIKASGFEYQPREIERLPGISGASCTVVKERLRIQVPASSESTLSGRVVYEPWVPGQESD
jgi:hypothetical protein